MSGLFLCGFLGWAWRGGGLMRSADLDVGVDKIRQEIPFFVCFGAARAGFGVGGRTFFQILEILFYF